MKMNMNNFFNRIKCYFYRVINLHIYMIVKNIEQMNKKNHLEI